ncbi:hypothetical protein VTK26DRAFT_3020 [Humicola hyalothermophila]
MSDYYYIYTGSVDQAQHQLHHHAQHQTQYQAQQQTHSVAFRPSRPEDWEPYREVIANYYNTMNMKLKDVMFQMEVTYGFKATEKQYKTQLKKWNLDTKYIKASEYMFMIKTIRERQAENPPKETRFVLRGRVVDPKDITRFEKRAQKKGLMKEGDPIEVNEPIEDLVYGTPPPDGAYDAYSSFVLQTTPAQGTIRTPPELSGPQEPVSNESFEEFGAGPTSVHDFSDE